MPRYPGAQWHPVGNERPGGMTGYQFGSVPAASPSVDIHTQITATSPAPNASGAVDVTVTTAAGTSALGPADQFTYASAG